MATNETTDFAVNLSNSNSENVIGEKNLSEKNWQAVTISGIAGILMGAGAMYATEAMASPSENTDKTTDNKEDTAETTSNGNITGTGQAVVNGIYVASVDQNLSFGQAFAAARAEVGPGGVFHWHGGVFNTYLQNEWNQMSSSERAVFARQVQPIIQAKPDSVSLQGDGSNIHIHVHIHNYETELVSKPDELKPDEPKPDEPKPDEPKPDEPNPDEPNPDEPKPEVHALGFDKIDIEGQEYEAAHMTLNSNHIYLLDLDNDSSHVLETGIADLNGDGRLTMNERFDMSEHHITIEQFRLASELENQNRIDQVPGGNNHVAHLTQDEIAPGMPDYMPDANPQV